MSPFDTHVCHECQICLRFLRILKVILEMAFSTHCTQMWKLNGIRMTIITVMCDSTLQGGGGRDCAVGLESVMKITKSACWCDINHISSLVSNICMHNTPMVMCVWIYMNILLCAHFSYRMVHCGIWDWCIVGFLIWVYYTSAMETTLKEVVNSLAPSAAYMHQWMKSALVQIMACCLYGTKPLSKPMLGYCQLDA